MRVASFFILVLTFVYCNTYSQNATISGYVSDASSGEPLIGANLYDNDREKGTSTNEYGFFSYTTDTGKVQLRCSYTGYQSSEIQIKLDKDTMVELKLEPSIELDVVEVTADQREKIDEDVQMSTVRLPIEQIKKIPALLGERDVLKALQLMPGVQSGGEGQSGLYVRGGSPDQNLMLLDGVPVYNASHIFGFFSVFNPDAIKDVKMIKGGFPARYGGRLSSVVDIRLKEGNRKSFHGSFDLGVVASKFMLEGPIGNDEKTSFMVSARRTYIDLLARPIINSTSGDDQDVKPTFFFYDINAKVNHKLSDKDQIYLSVYGGDDHYGIEEAYETNSRRDYTNIGLQWGNITSSLRWNHVWGPKLFSNLTATYTRYRFQNSNRVTSDIREDGQWMTQDDVGLSYDSGISDFGLKLDFDYLPHPDHHIRWGGQIIFHQFNPGTFDLLLKDGNSSLDSTIRQQQVNAWESNLFLEDDWEVNKKLRLNLGLHVSSFHTGGKSYFSAQPRLSARYKLGNNWALKGSFATMRQYLQFLTNENLSLPTDLWLPSTNRIAPQDAWQVALGTAKSFKNKWEFSAEVYYKGMDNVLALREGSSLFEFSDWQDRVAQGKGESYGLELLLRKKKGRLSGWLAYTLAWSNRQFEEINFGRKFPFRYDRRHDFSIVGMYEITPNINVSATWVYGSGYPVTLAYDQFNYYQRQDPNGPAGELNRVIQLENFKSRNNYRMPDYHRLDIGFDFKKEKKRGTRTWSIGAYNVYNRKNALFIFTEEEPVPGPGDETETVLKQASLFPIIPYITYKYEF